MQVGRGVSPSRHHKRIAESSDVERRMTDRLCVVYPRLGRRFDFAQGPESVEGEASPYLYATCWERPVSSCLTWAQS